MHDSFQGVKKQ